MTILAIRVIALIPLLSLLVVAAPANRTRGCRVKTHTVTVSGGTGTSTPALVVIPTTSILGATDPVGTPGTTTSDPGAVVTEPVSAVASSAGTVSSSTSAAISTPSTGTIGDGMVGLGWNDDSGMDTAPFIAVPGSKLSWTYNWWRSPGKANTEGLEFVPMIWGESYVASVVTDEATWPASTKYILSFNEPDLTSQADMTVAQAVTDHKAWVKLLTGNYSISSPAVTDGGKAWLVDWISQCAGECQYDFVPLHYYGTSATAFAAYVADMYKTVNKPIWVTEFGCHDYSSDYTCTAAESTAFMKDTIAFMRSTDYVKRWAWFGAFPDMAGKGDGRGLMNADSTPNAAGQLYVTL